MFGISFMEIAVILAISLFFFKPSDIFTFLGKLINFIETLKAKLEDLKNEAFIESLTKEDVLKDITPFEETSDQDISDNYNPPSQENNL